MFGGVLSGSGTVVQDGPGTLVLAGMRRAASPVR